MLPPTGSSRLRARWGVTVALAWVGLTLGSANCTFPEYDSAAPSAEAGSAAAAGAASGGSAGDDGNGSSGKQSELPTAGSGAEGGVGEGGAPTTPGGSGGDESSAGAPTECAPPQWPVEHCAADCLTRYPDHCYDGSLSGDESASDCGGSCQRCTNEACTNDGDCLSASCRANDAGKSFCAAPLRLLYTGHEFNSMVPTTAWSLQLFNQEPTGGRTFTLKDLELRYYFARSGITEPIFTHGTQANLKLVSGESKGLTETSWNIERTEPTENATYDAYVAVGFADGGQLFPGDHIELYQQLLSGDQARSNFDQRANYSFTKVPDQEWLHVTVFYRGELVWGLEPRPTSPRACFARGVNLNGPALTINGKAFQAAAQAMVTSTGSAVSQTTSVFPEAPASVAKLLETATKLQAGQSLELEADNATYLVYLYALSPASDGDPSRFTLQGAEPDSSGGFRPQAADGGQAWAKVGPYRVDVTNGALTLGVTQGAINFSGIELWYPD